MVRKIALEEHFLSPEYIEPWRPTVAEMPAAKRDYLLGSLTDFGERRLAMMDHAGIARAVLGLAGPGAQVERDTAKAIRDARASNDFLAKEIQKRPDRYSGFAHLAMQDANAAADVDSRRTTAVSWVITDSSPSSIPSPARVTSGASLQDRVLPVHSDFLR